MPLEIISANSTYWHEASKGKRRAPVLPTHFLFKNRITFSPKTSHCIGLKQSQPLNFHSSYKLLIFPNTIYYKDTDFFSGRYATRKIYTNVHPGPEWRAFITTLVRILMTSFLAFSLFLVQSNQFVYTIKRNYTVA